jgi:hypothetical protein
VGPEVGAGGWDPGRRGVAPRLGQTEGCFCGNEEGAVVVAWYVGEILSESLAAVLKHGDEDDQGDLVDTVTGSRPGAMGLVLGEPSW